MYPDDCVQSIIANPAEWWIANEERKLCRGALVQAFIPHVDQTPYTFEPIGRNQATEHGEARIKVAPLKVDQPLREITLPVAAMPRFPGEQTAPMIHPCEQQRLPRAGHRHVVEPPRRIRVLIAIGAIPVAV